MLEFMFEYVESGDDYFEFTFFIIDAIESCGVGDSKFCFWGIIYEFEVWPCELGSNSRDVRDCVIWRSRS